jgi:hypothetical protein
MQHRLEIGAIKTDQATYRWFRVQSRPARATDALGPYKFFPQPAEATFQFDPAYTLQDFGLRTLDDWERDGSITVDVFSWWFERGIGDLILTEFDMYLHHLRRINGKANYGWLRSMFYSTRQQLMRVYYARQWGGPQ